MKKGFVIDSLPRTGSTTLARLLSCHPDIRCLIEPFHPRRYDGQFFRMALEAGTAAAALNLIWHRWSGIKHVWDASQGWPFRSRPEVNDSIVLEAGHVIFLERRNLLRRYVSEAISQQLDFWIGTQQQFRARLENVQLRELDPAAVLQELHKDKAAVERRLQLMEEHNVPMLRLFYEDIFEEGVAAGPQFAIMNNILGFLGFPDVSEHTFMQQWAPLLDRSTYRWASPEIYRMVPAIESLEREVGSDETGWLF